MKAPVETVRVSQRAKDTLIKLKRRTGIEQWNVICRWALCTSLSSEHPPTEGPIADSNIEMTWKTFGGPIADELSALIHLRADIDGVPKDSHHLAAYFRNHLERGISQITGVKDLSKLMDLK
jgi:DNA sulfur modification protein DndE